MHGFTKNSGPSQSLAPMDCRVPCWFGFDHLQKLCWCPKWVFNRAVHKARHRVASYDPIGRLLHSERTWLISSGHQ
jgi:hypothetical protein